MQDVLVIGAGVMGCASALALARRRISTCVLERSVPGAEASSAAAGILGAQAEAHADGPMARLCLASRARFPGWVAELAEHTRLDVGYRPSGVVHASFDSDELAKIVHGIQWQREAELPFEVLDGRAARALEPALAESVVGAVRFPDDAVIDPPSLLRALRIAAERAGAVFRSGSLVRRIVVEGGRARGVALEDGTRIEAATVVLAAGSWSTLVDGAPLPADAVRPARGQIVELCSALPRVRSVVYGPRCYFSPRDDGRVLVGSTLEFVGFRPGVTAQAVRDLLDAAIELAPILGDAAVGRTWSSFRPHTKDELPLLGHTSVQGLLLATGHFRNGILLAPLTAEIIAALAAGEEPPADVRPFASTRLG